MRKRLSMILLLAGGAALLFCATVWYSSALFERYQAAIWTPKFKQALSVAPVPASPPVSPPTQVASSKWPVHHQNSGLPMRLLPKNHDVIAWLEIPRLHISTAVLEGDDRLALQLGAGHIPGTPLPGEGGNIGIAAHRDSFFSSLSRVHPDDEVLLWTSLGASRYAVESTRVVPPSNVGVLAKSSGPVLTLVTCYPFRYIGPAPLRFIVRARRTS